MENKLREKLAGKIKLPQDMIYEKTLLGHIEPGVEPYLKFTGFKNPLPENFVIITSKDIPGKNSIRTPYGEYPFLIEDQQLYNGQPLYLAAARSQKELISLKEEIKPEWMTGKPQTPVSPLFQRYIEKGDTDTVFSNSAAVFKNHMFLPSLKNIAFQPYSVFCRQEGKNWIIHTSSSWPDIIRTNCARILNIQESRIQIKNYPSQAVDNNRIFTPVFTSACAVLLCLKSGNSINLTLNPSQNILYTPGSGAFSLETKAALTSKGNLDALKINIEMFSGPELHMEPEILDRIVLAICSIYRIKNISVKATAIRSSGFFPMGGCGAGSSISSICLEPFIHQICSSLEENMTDWKKRNTLEKGNTIVQGLTVKHQPPYNEIIGMLEDISDLNRKMSSFSIAPAESEPFTAQPRRGIGLSLGTMGNGFLNHINDMNTLSVKVTLDTDSKLHIEPSVLPSHAELYNQWRMKAMEMLSLSAEDVLFISSNTPHCNMFSRNITEITRLINLCLIQIQKKRFREALPLELKKSYRKPKKQWDCDHFSGLPYKNRIYAGAVIELEIHPGECFPRIKDIWVALECGKILNKKIAINIIEAEIYQSLSWCCYGESDGSTIHNGLLRNSQPGIHIHFLETGKEPLGIEGAAASVIPGALLQAVNQILDEPVSQLPLTRNRIKHGWPKNGD